jgi:VWFA-related protein
VKIESHTKIVFAAVTLAVVCLSLALARAQSAPPQQTQQAPPATVQEPVERVTVELVRLVFTVTNRRNKFITDLQRANFKVYENKQPQDIVFFGSETDLPLRVGILMDTSNSIRDRLKFEQEAAIDFVHNVVRRQKDLAFLMTFDTDSGLLQDYTDDAGKITQVIQRQRAGGGTALHDAIYFACQQRLQAAPPPPGPNPETRKIIVLISDGEDTHSERARSEAIEACQRAEASVYAISTSTDWLSVSGNEPRKYHKTEGDKILENIAEETGGRAFFPYRIDDLAASFQDIGVELRSQYSLAYSPTNRTNDGKFRNIKIEVLERKGLLVRARKGYFPAFGKTAAASPAPTSNP